jgi:beta-lactamase class D
MPTPRLAALLALLAACGRAAAPSPPPPTAPAIAAAPALAPLPPIAWARHGLAAEGCFLLRDLATGAEQVNDAARCARARRPNSTFKIVNALVAVDLGLLDGPDALLRWDAARYPIEPDRPAAWYRDQPLRDAIQMSAVPLFRGLARAIGPDRMAAALARLAYGNQILDGGPDAFWLRGGLRITPRRQLDLIAGLLAGTLPVSRRAHEVVRAILRQDGDGPRRGGKTGSGNLEDEVRTRVDTAAPMFGWMVGWIELPDRTVAYAMWIEGPSYAAMAERRTAIVDEVLADLATPQ